MKNLFFIIIFALSLLSSCATQEKPAALASIIELVGDDMLSLQALEAMDLQANFYYWKNRVAVYGVFPDAEAVQKQIAEAYPNVSVRLYDKPFYVFDRQNCVDAKQAAKWSHTVMTANLVEDTVLQQEYMDYHDRQAELFPEVALGFCRADFQQLLVFRNGRQLMLVISIPEGKNLDDLNPKTTENNPRVDEWNVIMAKYQEGIEGTEPEETWVVLNLLK